MFSSTAYQLASFNLLDHIVGWSPEGEKSPYIVYKISPPDQRILLWDIEEPKLYTAVVELLVRIHL